MGSEDRPRFLLDSSAAVALGMHNHESWHRVTRFITRHDAVAILCPITQGAILRVFLSTAKNSGFQEALAVLNAMAERDWYGFLPNDLDYADVPARGIHGHRQVTDAYLAQLARRHGVKLATLDESQAILHRDVAVLIPHD